MNEVNGVNGTNEVEWNEVDVNEVKRSDGISGMNEVNGTEGKE
jgi:hypothetical protein